MTERRRVHHQFVGELTQRRPLQAVDLHQQRILRGAQPHRRQRIVINLPDPPCRAPKRGIRTNARMRKRRDMRIGSLLR